MRKFLIFEKSVSPSAADPNQSRVAGNNDCQDPSQDDTGDSSLCSAYSTSLNQNLNFAINPLKPRLFLHQNIPISSNTSLSQFYIKLNTSSLQIEALARTNAFFRNIRDNKHSDIHNYEVYNCQRDLGSAPLISKTLEHKRAQDKHATDYIDEVIASFRNDMLLEDAYNETAM